MANKIFQDVNSVLTLLDDANAAGANSLASLANGHAAITGTGTFNGSPPSSIDNTSAAGSPRQDFWMDLELTVYFGTAPTAGRTVDVYLLSSVDGTNYPDGDTAGPITVGTQLVASFPVRNVTTKQIISVRGIPIPSTKFQLQIVNNTDQNFAATTTGSKLKALTYREQYN